MKNAGDAMYLVVLSHTMDDLPIRLFSDRAEAEKFAGKVEVMPEETERIRALFRAARTMPLCVSIVTFRGGVPQKRDVVKSFDGPWPIPAEPNPNERSES